MVKSSKNQIEELLTRGVEAIYPSKEALESILESGKKLKLYQGFDPTGVKLHIGHMVGLMKLRQWQELGHEVIFLIGDGTGQAGDPSGKTRGREKYLTNKELRENAKDYVMQAGKIVKFKGDNAAKILYNGDWLNKLDLVDILNILNHFSLQQLQERDLFAKRIKTGEIVNMREVMYPVLQAYDSVAMNVDLELGGQDQIFNMLSGRSLMKKMLDKEKFVMATMLLSDSSGKKIGKTEGNVIALDAEPKEFFGMMMSLSDDVIIKCFESITEVPMERVREMQSRIEAGENPMVFKKKLAFELVKMLNGESAAKTAQAEFEKVFSNKEMPGDMPEIVVAPGNYDLPLLMINLEAVPSVTKARMLIEQGAVKVDEAKITDPKAKISVRPGMVVQVGKRSFYKIK
jgi:tyrosyl-tRNA synthetase